VHTLILADGPTRYFGGSVETFALPMGAFIVIGLVLFFIYRRPHSVARLKYLTPATQVSTATREPGTPGLVRFAAAKTAKTTETAESGGEATEETE
jgi:hypothetical protein